MNPLSHSSGYLSYRELDYFTDNPEGQNYCRNQNPPKNPFTDHSGRQGQGGIRTPEDKDGLMDQPTIFDPRPRPFGFTHTHYDIDIDIDIDIDGNDPSTGTKCPGDKGPDNPLGSVLDFLKSLSPEQLQGLRDFIQLIVGQQGNTGTQDPGKTDVPGTHGGGDPGKTDGPGTHGSGDPGKTDAPGTQGPEDTTPQSPTSREMLLKILEFLTKLLEELGGDGESDPIGTDPPTMQPMSMSSSGPPQKRISRKDIPKDEISHYNPNAFHGTKSAVVLAKGIKAKSVTIDGVKFRKHGSHDNGREVWVADKPGIKGDAKVDYSDGKVGNYKFSDEGIQMATG